MINGVQTEYISVRDRGLQYGDGCFETLRIYDGQPLLLSLHLERLEATCKLLHIQYDTQELNRELTEFLRECETDGVLKIVITRGIGGRGYSSGKNSRSTRIIMYSPLPTDYATKGATGVSIVLANYRLSENAALAGSKHLNRLDQVMASLSLKDSIDEALCLDQIGNVIEGTKSNLVLVIDKVAITPQLNNAGVRGVMLAYLTQRFADANIAIRSRNVSIENLRGATELFLCNSVIGVWPVCNLLENDTVRSWPIGSLTKMAMRYNDEIPAQAI